LISLPLTKATNVKWLDEVGLMGGVLYYPNIVHFGLENEIRSIMASSAIDQEYMPQFSYPAFVRFDKVIEPS
jgi:hypothetical protein